MAKITDLRVIVAFQQNNGQLYRNYYTSAPGIALQGTNRSAISLVTQEFDESTKMHGYRQIPTMHPN